MNYYILYIGNAYNYIVQIISLPPILIYTPYLYRKPKQTAVKKYGDHTHPLGSLSKKAKIDQKLKSLR